MTSPQQQATLLTGIQTCSKLSCMGMWKTNAPGRASWAENAFEQLVVLIRFQTAPGTWRETGAACWVTCPRWLILSYRPSHTRVFPEKPSERIVCHIGPATLQAQKRVKLYHWGDRYKIICDQFWCRNLRSCSYARANARDIRYISTYSFLICQILLEAGGAQILLSTKHHRSHSDFVLILL